MDAGRATAAPPVQSQPVVQQVSQPVPLASGAPEEYIVKEGDTLRGKVLEVSRDGKIRLSHKAVLEGQHESKA
jgi:polyribonucleotide nucleotidyltransferase